MILTPNMIFDATEEVTDYTREQIQTKSRKQDLVYARDLVRYFLCEHTRFSLHKIGEYTCGADHSTVIHSRDKVNDALTGKAKGFDLILQWHGEIKKRLEEKAAQMEEINSQV